MKSLYGDAVDSYFSQGAVFIQLKQRWDKEKCGVIGDDYEVISLMIANVSWWDDSVGNSVGAPIQYKVATDTTKRKSIDAKKLVTRDIYDNEDNLTFPSLHANPVNRKKS